MTDDWQETTHWPKQKDRPSVDADLTADERSMLRKQAENMARRLLSVTPVDRRKWQAIADKLK